MFVCCADEGGSCWWFISAVTTIWFGFRGTRADWAGAGGACACVDIPHIWSLTLLEALCMGGDIIETALCGDMTTDIGVEGESIPGEVTIILLLTDASKVLLFSLLFFSSVSFKYST